MFEVVEPFYIVKTTHCCQVYFNMQKYRFFRANSPSGQSGSTTLETLAENIEEAFEKRLYITNYSSHLNLHDNSLLLVTTRGVAWGGTLELLSHLVKKKNKKEIFQ